MKDYKGKKFGRLTVIEFDKKTKNVSKKGKTYYSYYWKCKCDCGKETSVLLGNLIKGTTKSCGCLDKESREQRIKEKSEKNFQDLTGRKFGRLTTRLDHLSNKVTKQNTTGVRGVSYQKRNGKYRAYIYFKNKCINLGEFTKLQDAAKARANAEEKYYKPILEKYNYKSKKLKENEEEFE